MMKSHDLAIAYGVKQAMKRKKMAMGGDVPNEHDQDMAEFKSDEMPEPLMQDAEEADQDEEMGMAHYAFGGLHKDPMSMVKAIRAKKFAKGGMVDRSAIEANEFEGKQHNMDDWLASGDADLEQEEMAPHEKRKAMIRRAMMKV